MKSHKKSSHLSVTTIILIIFMVCGSVMIFSLSYLIHDNNNHVNPKPKVIETLSFQNKPLDTPLTVNSVPEPETMEPKVSSAFRSLNSLYSSSSNDLEKLKEIGGTGTTIDPVTHRQRLSAFAKEFNSSRYENINCPDFPEPGYPKTYPMKAVLDNWNPDDTTIPPFHYNSLCYFNYQTELQKALNYRDAELPFVVYNVPEIDAVVKRWDNLNYLNERAGPNKKYKTATSEDNHFMYYNRPDNKGIYKDQLGRPWKRPTGQVDMTFSQWVRTAVENHNKSLEEREHYYFRISTDGPNHWIFDELTFFQPKKSFFMVKPSDQKGIHCRFGMKSVISENHWDGSRNYAVTFFGMRRWILNHPNQCKSLYMFPNGHPSARHSSIDWSKPDYSSHPLFASAETNEIIAHPGDALYLPTNWFHYIISLNVNLQCNTRSGRTTQYDYDVRDGCGL